MIPATNAAPPTIGFRMIVCGLDMSIVKNPKSAARSVVKYVKLGTAKATMPRTTRINPITMSGRILSLLLVSNTPLAEHDGEPCDLFVAQDPPYRLPRLQ